MTVRKWFRARGRFTLGLDIDWRTWMVGFTFERPSQGELLRATVALGPIALLLDVAKKTEGTDQP